MRLKNPFLTGHQVIGVILQEGGSLCTGYSGGHNLHQSDHAGGLPVALCAKAVALFHESLDGQTRKLAQSSQHTEMGNHRMIVSVLQEFLKADLNGGLYCHRLPECLFVPAVGDQPVASVIFLHSGVHFPFGHGLNIFHGVIDIVMVDLPAKFDLGLHLVSLGNRHIVHVVSQTADPQMAGLHDSHGGAHPASQLLLKRRIGPVAHNDLSLNSHAADNMTVFPVPVS